MAQYDSCRRCGADGRVGHNISECINYSTCKQILCPNCLSHHNCAQFQECMNTHTIYTGEQLCFYDDGYADEEPVRYTLVGHQPVIKCCHCNEYKPILLHELMVKATTYYPVDADSVSLPVSTDISVAKFMESFKKPQLTMYTLTSVELVFENEGNLNIAW